MSERDEWSGRERRLALDLEGLLPGCTMDFAPGPRAGTQAAICTRNGLSVALTFRWKALRGSYRDPLIGHMASALLTELDNREKARVEIAVHMRGGWWARFTRWIGGGSRGQERARGAEGE